MKIIIIWQNDFQLLTNTMEKLINDNQCFLFTVLCGGTDDKNIYSSLGYQWAKINGAPIELLIEPNLEKLLDKIVSSADYLVCYNNGNQIVKRLIMKFKIAGKHGTVIT